LPPGAPGRSAGAEATATLAVAPATRPTPRARRASFGDGLVTRFFVLDTAPDRCHKKTRLSGHVLMTDVSRPFRSEAP
jgi:hypothetical protein